MARTLQPPRILVLGDLVLDVVLAPDRPLDRGTDVPGRTMLRQGGSAANTARWLGRLGVRPTLVCAVGRDTAGRALVAVLAADGVRVRATRVAGARTGRIGVLVEPAGQRSFVADRGAADQLRPGDVDPRWFAGLDAVHLPAYSLLGRPLGDAGLAATRLAHAAGALLTLDLASSGPLLERGRRAALALVRQAAPDLVFATADEAEALAGRRPHAILDLAPVAVIKRGPKGATVMLRGAASPGGDRDLRFDVATTPFAATDTTGAGDAFDAGFLAAWLAARRRGLTQPAALRRGAVAGNRTALRQLANPPGELALG